MPCLLIYGVSGAGKSMLLEKFKRDHAPKRASRNGHDLLLLRRCLGTGRTTPVRRDRSHAGRQCAPHRKGSTSSNTRR
jgi:GTPase SAR1 family protein